jgi:hypothetical protein
MKAAKCRPINVAGSRSVLDALTHAFADYPLSLHFSS